MRVKTDERRKVILAVASTVFRDRGFAGASMDAIALGASISKATLYNYFSSKDELFVETMFDHVDRQRADMHRALDSDADIKSILLGFADAYFKLVTKSDILPFYRTIIGANSGPKLRRLFYERGPKAGWQKMEAVMSRAMDRQELRLADPKTAAMQFRALLEAEWMQPRLMDAHPPITAVMAAQYIKAALETFMRAYRQG